MWTTSLRACLVAMKGQWCAHSRCPCVATEPEPAPSLGSSAVVVINVVNINVVNSTVVNIKECLFFVFRRVHRGTRLFAAQSIMDSQYRSSILLRFPSSSLPPSPRRSIAFGCVAFLGPKTLDATRHIDVIRDVFKERFLNASYRRHSYLGTILLRHLGALQRGKRDFMATITNPTHGKLAGSRELEF
jgi:hypothetical protein